MKKNNINGRIWRRENGSISEYREMWQRNESVSWRNGCIWRNNQWQWRCENGIAMASKAIEENMAAKIAKKKKRRKRNVNISEAENGENVKALMA